MTNCFKMEPHWTPPETPIKGSFFAMSGAFGITVCRQLTKWNIFGDFFVQKVNKKRVFCDLFRVLECFKHMFIKHLYKITSFGCLRDFRYSTSEIANFEEHTGKILSKVAKNRLKSV